MISLVSFKSAQPVEEPFLAELFSAFAELVFEFRYDFLDFVVPNPKKNRTPPNKPHFNLFLRDHYKIPNFNNYPNPRSLSLSFFLQKKETNSAFIQVESWSISILHYKCPKNEEVPNSAKARVCGLLKSLVCFLTSTPLWKDFLVSEAQNIDKTQYFLDHEVFVNSKPKVFCVSDPGNLIERSLEVKTEAFTLLFKVQCLSDLGFLSQAQQSKPKGPLHFQSKGKRERFLSEGTCLESPEKPEGTPYLRFFAQWGIEEGEISHRKVVNHFKAHNVPRGFHFCSSEFSKEEIEVIDSELELGLQPPEKKGGSEVFEEDNNQFELITEETDMKKQNSDYQIIGKEKGSDTTERIMAICQECFERLGEIKGDGKVWENLRSLGEVLKSLD